MLIYLGVAILHIRRTNIEGFNWYAKLMNLLLKEVDIRLWRTFLLKTECTGIFILSIM